MYKYGLFSFLALLCITGSSCAATRGWFTRPATQIVIAEGCKAAAMDDNMQNALLNQAGGAIPQLAPVMAAVNSAHLAIQAAYAKCVADASAVVTEE